jgi:hypothetical protein
MASAWIASDLFCTKRLASSVCALTTGIANSSRAKAGANDHSPQLRNSMFHYLLIGQFSRFCSLWDMEYFRFA